MNTKGLLKYIVLLVVVAIVYALVKSQAPKEVDWSQTYDNRHKIPYGTRALFEMLPTLFDTKTIKVARKPVYNVLKDSYTTEYHYDEGDEIDESTTLNEVKVEGSNLSLGDPDSAGYYSDSAYRRYDSLKALEKTSDAAPEVIDEIEPFVLNKPITDYKWQTQKLPYQTYIFIDSYFQPDDTDEEELFNFVGRGNVVFVAAEEFKASFENRLKFGTLKNRFPGMADAKVSNVVRLTEGPYWGKAYPMDDQGFFSYFSYLDSLKCKVLGTNKDGDPNLLSLKYGEGYFLISTAPKAFTNYHVLHDNNNEYAAAVLSYLPKSRPVIWDQFYKEGSLQGKSSNPLRVLLENDSARTALYLILVLFILYIIFIGKRTQRIIPVIKPFTNSSVEFTQTVGRLYYQKRDHRNLALKKFYYLLDFIRQHYFMGSNKIDRQFSDKLAAKTGYNPNSLWLIFSAVESIKMRDTITEEELIVFNNNIENFYTHIHSSTKRKPEIIN